MRFTNSRSVALQRFALLGGIAIAVGAGAAPGGEVVKFSKVRTFRSSGFSVGRPGFGRFAWLVEGPHPLPSGPEEGRPDLREGRLLADDYDVLRGIPGVKRAGEEEPVLPLAQRGN